MVTGVERLTGADLCCTDLRGGAAVVLGALAARGQSTVTGLAHIDRGYDDFAGKLARLGADIQRIEGKERKEGTDEEDGWTGTG